MTDRLSTLQYNMLRTFAAQPEGQCMSIATAQTLDQRPFRSMLMREWVTYRPEKGFHITRKGREVFRSFESHSIERKNPSLPLTSYFDPALYGLRHRPRGGRAARRGLRAVA